MIFLLGIDDTDNLESRGTGFRARQLGNLLADLGVTMRGITRHQLFVSPEIPYTSHNSSACLDLDDNGVQADAIWQVARQYLLDESAPGADAGLCLAALGQVDPEVQDFGSRAKRIVLTQADALELAAKQKIGLEGLTGTGGGIIGALAAVGLYAGGNDGRFLWLRGIRELSGAHTVMDIMAQTGLGAVVGTDGRNLLGHEMIQLGDWNRPILQGGQAVLLVEEVEHGTGEWRVVSKDEVKRRSQ